MNENKLLVGRYLLREVIGEGGFSVVYSAIDNVRNKKVVVKILKEEYSLDHKQIVLFKKEASIALKLRHKNIVKTLDSGRDGNKDEAAGLTPVAIGDSVAYEEAELTFLCHKLYQHQLTKEDIVPEIAEYYKTNPKVYPPDEDGEWQPHWLFIGEIIEVIDKRNEG